MKKYRAKIDTVIEGAPKAEGADIDARNIPEDRLDGYLKAGLIEEIKPGKEGKADKASAEANKVDTTEDKRLEK